MPMDIRMFFTKKEGKSKKGKAKKPSKTVEEKAEKGKNDDKQSAATVARVPKETKKAEKKTKKKLIIIDSDEEDTAQESPSPRKRKATTAASKSSSSTDDELVQVSTSKFFADSSASSMPSKKPRSSPSENLTNLKQKRSVETAPKPTQSSTYASSAAKKPRRNSSSSKTPKKKPASPSPPSLKPSRTLDSFDVNDERYAGCLEGKTFCLTGLLPDWSREDATDFLKILGARVTTAVSSKTNYLLVGDILEDGREYTEGSKYRKAMDLGTVHIVRGEKALYGLAQQYQELREPTVAAATATATTTKTKDPPPVTAAAKPPPSAAKPAVVNNPYAAARKQKAVANPYAKAVNPYAKKAATSSSSTNTTSQPNSKPAATKTPAGMTNTPSTNELWVDKYKPKHSREILGNQEAVRKLQAWLRTWEEKFNTAAAVKKTFSAPHGPWKAALLSGPPGIGKTTTATLVAQESGRDVLEFNASDVRSKKSLQEGVGDITGSRTLEFCATTSQNRIKRCIIMDEVDGMGAGDRSGMSELIQMIKKSRVPIICICNDRQNQKMKSLLPYCMDLRYRRPVKSTIAKRALQVAQQEGLSVETNAAEAIAESCGNDVRQVLNCLQMWASNSTGNKKSRMTYKDLKDRERVINKDEILRVSLFDAARSILEGRRGLAGATPEAERAHFYRRNDAFFVDYNFLGLLVQQNYLKVVQGGFNQAKRSPDPSAGTLEVLERMHEAADSLSEYAMAENSLRGGQNWSLLPFTAALTVKAGYHAGGESGGMLPGFPEFTSWLGKNSSRGKKLRILQELQHHVNYKVSGGTQALRMSYVPVFRAQFKSLLYEGAPESLEKTIELMDEYGLNRDDVFERFDEFKITPKDRGLADLDSKRKAAFTRTYNKGAHKSQALVAEQGGGGKKKTKRGDSGAAMSETVDPDAINDDKVKEEEEEEEANEEEDDEQIKAMFRRKGRKAAAKKGASKKKAPAKKKASKKK